MRTLLSTKGTLMFENFKNGSIVRGGKKYSTAYSDSRPREIGHNIQSSQNSDRIVEQQFCIYFYLLHSKLITWVELKPFFISYAFSPFFPNFSLPLKELHSIVLFLPGWDKYQNGQRARLRWQISGWIVAARKLSCGGSSAVAWHA